MSYKIVIYCPDRHIEYDGETPYKVGVGGGISARIRMAEALHRAGNQVRMVVNCKNRCSVNGVEYQPLEDAQDLVGDVVILNTSGGDLDLRPSLDLEIVAKLRLIWLHGYIRPLGLEEVDYDVVYAVSNYIRDVVYSDWNIPGEKIFVTYNAFDNPSFRQHEDQFNKKVPHRIIYFSHPSKGLEPAVEVVRILRRTEPSFHLDVFGGSQLWGEDAEEDMTIDGVHFHGLVGQDELISELLKSTYSIHLQTREEPGALAIMEAMRAGCIILGSPVGCYPEYITHGRTGFLIPGDPWDLDVAQKAADVILDFNGNQEAQDFIRQQAQNIIWNSDTMAQVWVRHWDHLLKARVAPVFKCIFCSGVSYLLRDGYHCSSCGRYHQHLQSQTPSEYPLPDLPSNRTSK